MKVNKIAVLGCGNIGLSIANGLVHSKKYSVKQIILTRRNLSLLDEHKEKGFEITNDNRKAVESSELVIVAVQPQQLNELLLEVQPSLVPKKHIIISVVSGASLDAIQKIVGDDIPVVRAMPNTAIAIQESMTCLASGDNEALKIAQEIFNTLGSSLIIKEELMGPATALCACGIAFFLRAIRAASQGGIEIGFHAEEAILMASQTAKGAAQLLLQNESHPESEVDKVTTPRGITISGLNQMEHYGFSSAMIKGIVTSAEKAAKIYADKKE
jgi:pyrroline-5-carboxylate reductase